MTDDTKAEVLVSAKQGKALLSGKKARLVVICYAILGASVPMLTYIPSFDNWRDVIAWTALFVWGISSPMLAGLVPKEEQEWYRQALLDSEAQRRAMHSELQTYKTNGGIIPPRGGG
ncbi:MAG: hypothetical protein ABIU84_08870 [Thermoanaerobaculia bacterium]